MDLGRVSVCRYLNGYMNIYFLRMYGGLHKIEKNVSLLHRKQVQLTVRRVFPFSGTISLSCRKLNFGPRMPRALSRG